MKQLIKYELKKIGDKRMNQIAMLFGLLLIVVCDLLRINGETLAIDDSERWRGLNAIKKQEAVENALTDELTEEFLTDFLRTYQRQSKGVWDEEAWRLIIWKRNLFRMIMYNYTDLNEHFEWEHLCEIPTENDIGFYEQRLKKIESLLNADYSYGNFTEAEKSFWRRKAEAVHTPFAWGSPNTWDKILDSIGILFFLLFVVSICTASVFSGEYQGRTDALLLSSKYGKNRLIYAKMAASFLFTLSYMALGSLLSIGINVALLGTKGWHLPIQLWNTVIPYDWNVLEVCVVNLLVIFLCAFLLTGISLLLSALCKSPLAVLVLDIIFLYSPLFIPLSKESRLWNRILYLAPANTFGLGQVLKSYNSYQFGDLVISYLGMTVIVYLLLLTVCVANMERIFGRHQVGA